MLLLCSQLFSCFLFHTDSKENRRRWPRCCMICPHFLSDLWVCYSSYLGVPTTLLSPRVDLTNTPGLCSNICFCVRLSACTHPPCFFLIFILLDIPCLSLLTKVQDACVGPCLFSFSDVILVVGMAPLIW